MPSPKVLLIASYAGCPRVWKMASTLADNSFAVTVLEWDRNVELSTREKVNNISVYRIKLKAPYGFRLILLLPIWWAQVIWFLFGHSFDAIQAQNLDSLLPSKAICYIRRTKIIYDIADFYADAYVPQNIPLLKSIVAKLEQALTKTADAVIIVDEARLHQVDRGKVPLSVIYNSPPDKFSELQTKAGKRPFSNSDFVLFYAGILSSDRNLESMVLAVERMESVKLIVAGFGAKIQEFSALVRQKRNVKFLGRIPYDDVLRLTFLSDCVIALYDPSFPINVVASPNKLFEAMMCGKPIIACNGTAMAKKILETNCGLVIDCSIAELKKAIISLRDNLDLSKTLGLNGRKVYCEKYSWSLMEKRLLQLYFSVI